MLVLTRKLGETIRIGDNISVTVVDLDGKSVKIGIDAPRSVSIHREEIYKKIRDENRQAVSSEKVDLGDIASLFKDKGRGDN